LKYAVAAYWIIGCLLLGAFAAHHERLCPHDDVKAIDALAFVAIWIEFVGYGLNGGHAGPERCDTP
jgi:hypothetical protein